MRIRSRTARVSLQRRRHDRQNGHLREKGLQRGSQISFAAVVDGPWLSLRFECRWRSSGARCSGRTDSRGGCHETSNHVITPPSMEWNGIYYAREDQTSSERIYHEKSNISNVVVLSHAATLQLMSCCLYFVASCVILTIRPSPNISGPRPRGH